MIANRILDVILTATSILTLPLAFVSGLVLAPAIALSFGILLIPLSVAWVLLLSPMLLLSWICSKVPRLRDIIGIIFVPWVFIANTFAAIVPSMGEVEGRAAKLMLCGSWPFTWEFWQFLQHKIDWFGLKDRNTVMLKKVVERMAYRDPVMERVLTRVVCGEQLDQ